ncbi:putative mitochondrial protein AtMg00310 [Castanea sativa]|uniref:putative mitochondrial protein AtMg00310 n=1 Tax=Castanea sativa TaxID=21020 RepID=UPI003F6524E3
MASQKRNPLEAKLSSAMAKGRNCDKLNSLSRRFWWKPKEKEGRCIAWKGWNKLCQPRCVGGLGFKKTREVNEALLAKFAWMAASSKQSLYMEVLRSKYNKEDWLRSEPSKSATPTWRTIERTNNLIEKGACFLLGDGKSINIWADLWVPCIEDFKLKPRIDDYL